MVCDKTVEIYPEVQSGLFVFVTGQMRRVQFIFQAVVIYKFYVFNILQFTEDTG